MKINPSILNVCLAFGCIALIYLLFKNGCNDIAVACNKKKSDKYEQQSAKTDEQLRQFDSTREVIIKKIEMQNALDSQANYYENLLKRSQQITANRKADEVVAAKEREVYVKKNKDTHETIKKAAKLNDNKQLLITIDSIRARLRHLSENE